MAHPRHHSPSRLVLAAAAALTTLGGATLTGCMHLGPDRSYVGPEPLPESLAQGFDHVRTRQAYTATPVEMRSAYTVRRIQFPSAVNVLDEHTIVIDYYDLHDDHDAPIVLVLPVLGGGNKIASYFASYFAANGLAAAIVHRQEQYKDTNDVETLNLVFEQIVLDHKQAIDWLEMQGDLDTTRIGLFGVSAGAIKGSLVYALDDRVDVAVLALAGGDLPYILAYSTEEGVAEKRAQILAEHDIDRDELYDVLKDEFRHDPLRYAPYMDARNALLILAWFDAVVPFRTGEALREAMGNPETIILPTGHYSAVLYIPVIQGAALEFLERKLR